MTTKDYKIIAEAFNAARKDHERADWRTIMDYLSEALKKDNPNFSYDKFYNACFNGIS